MPSLNIEIYSNDNNALLQTISLSSTESGFATVDSTGASFYKEGESTPDGIYTYTGEGVFTGFTITPNTTTPTYGIGDTFSIGINTNQHLNIVAGTAAKKITYDNKPVQVESAIRDGSGKVIADTYAKKPAVYERTTNSSTSTTCTLIQFNASDYKANGYLAHFRFRVRSVAQDAYPSDNEFIINYSYRSASIFCINNKRSTSLDIIQNIYAYYPSIDQYVDTGNYFIAFTTGAASTNFIIEMIEADVPYSIPATMSAPTTTNNTLYYMLSPGDYTYPLMWTGKAVGSITGSAESARTSNYTYGTEQKYFRVGEVDLYRLMAVDHTGVAYKINTSTKKFPLPISMYVGRGNSANTTSYNAITSIYGSSGYTNVSELISPSYNNFTMPTLTASDGGKTLYVRGSLDTDGYFVCDGNVTLSMEAGYTYIPFGTLDPEYGVDSNSGSYVPMVPDRYSFNAISAPAYTFDANGKLTHIDGKEISGGGGPSVIEYTVPTTISSGNVVIAEYNGTYDGSPGYVKFVMEVTSSSYIGVYVVEAAWGLANGGITLISGNAMGNDVGTLYLYYPSSTSNYVYPPVLSVYNAGTREKQVKITVLEDSGNLTWKTDWGTTVSTTGRTSRYVSLSNASQVYYADNASTATAASYATSLNAPIVATLPTSSGVKFCTNLTILSKTDTWFIETYAYYPYKFQRATAMSDPSEVAVRTSTDNGTTWSNWVYSYSVWHT